MSFVINPDISALLFFFVAGFIGCLGFRLCDWILRTFKEKILEWFT